jgi:hypothetical protein
MHTVTSSPRSRNAELKQYTNGTAIKARREMCG